MTGVRGTFSACLEVDVVILIVQQMPSIEQVLHHADSRPAKA